jgi:alpha-acetolactate decarboxylase
MIRLLTLKTNHTILGELLETDGDYYLIKQPVQVVMQPTKEGASIAFAPFLQFSEEFTTGIKINKSDVLCKTKPIVELQNQYNEVFGSGIQIASVIPRV